MSSESTVAIMYGFAEGGWHGRKLRRALSEAGFRVVKDPKIADIIIAHSGACYIVPQDTPAKLVLHVGYTYWPGRRLASSLKYALTYELKQHSMRQTFVRGAFHSLYALNIAHTAPMVPGWRDPKRGLDRLPPTRHVFVRNQHDSYCEPAALLHATSASYALISLPGGHLDLWDDPKPYVNLIQSVYG